MINIEKHLSMKISNGFRIEETEQVLLKPHSFSYSEELLSLISMLQLRRNFHQFLNLVTAGE